MPSTSRITAVYGCRWRRRATPIFLWLNYACRWRRVGWDSCGSKIHRRPQYAGRDRRYSGCGRWSCGGCYSCSIYDEHLRLEGCPSTWNSWYRRNSGYGRGTGGRRGWSDSCSLEASGCTSFYVYVSRCAHLMRISWTRLRNCQRYRIRKGKLVTSPDLRRYDLLRQILSNSRHLAAGIRRGVFPSDSILNVYLLHIFSRTELHWSLHKCSRTSRLIMLSRQWRLNLSPTPRHYKLH